MGMKLSKLYGMEIFTDGGKFVGSVQEIIVNLETGEVERILLESLPGSKDAAKDALKNKSILYKNVKSVEDVIVVSKGPGAAGAGGA